MNVIYKLLLKLDSYLAGAKQIDGEDLEYLNKLFNNSGVSNPTLSNRL